MARHTFEVPKHAKKVENGLQGFWKPEVEGQGLQGVVGEPIETVGADGNPNVFFAIRVTSETSGPIKSSANKLLKTEVGRLVGVGGRTLRNFLTEHKGREVVLVYTGLGEKKKGKNAPKLYDTYDLSEDVA
jgi:hypothetical protein